MSTIREEVFNVDNGIVQAAIEDFIIGDISWEELHEILINATSDSTDTTAQTSKDVEAYDRAMRGI